MCKEHAHKLAGIGKGMVRNMANRKTGSTKSRKKNHIDMKICENCGGAYQEDLELCPYCGAQSEEAAEKYYQGQMNELRKQRKRIEKLPHFLQKKATRRLFFAAILLLLCFVAGFAISRGVQKEETARQKAKEQQNIARMEEFLAQSDFKGLHEFYATLPYSYVVYDKYREISNMYYPYDFMMDNIKGWEDAKEYDWDESYYIEQAIKWLREMCKQADEMCFDKKLMGNETYIARIKDMGMENFKEAFGVSEELLEEILGAEALSEEEEDEEALRKQLAGKVLELE